jgi:hypothetical protein
VLTDTVSGKTCSNVSAPRWPSAGGLGISRIDQSQLFAVANVRLGLCRLQSGNTGIEAGYIGNS